MSVTTDTIDLPKGYAPSPDEEFMNPMQLKYFEKNYSIGKKKF